jgi:xylose isomerase
VVKLLEDNHWAGTRNFDEHPYRSEDEKGVWDFVTGSMKSYLILWDKVKRFNSDKKVQQILKAIHGSDPALEGIMKRYSADGAEKLKKHSFDPMAISKKRLPYEELDQRLQEILMGVA